MAKKINFVSLVPTENFAIRTLGSFSECWSMPGATFGMKKIANCTLPAETVYNFEYGIH